MSRLATITACLLLVAQAAIGQYPLRQSTASQEMLIGPFLSDTDGKTAQTGLTIANTDVKLWKHGATSEANKNSGGGTHVAAGRYYLVLDATDTDTVGALEINVVMSGALPVQKRCIVYTAAVYDALIAGSAPLDVNTTKIGGTTQTARDIGASVLLSSGTGAGQISLSSGAVTVGTNNDKTGYTASTVSDKTGYSLANGSIAAATFAAGAIDAAAIATGAITNGTEASGFGTAQTGDSYARIGAAGAGLTALGDTRLAYLDALISSRLATAGYTAPDNATITSIAGDLGTLAFDIGAIKGKTDNLPASPAAVGSAMTLTGAYDAAKTAASATDVKAQVVAALDTDTYAELTAVPSQPTSIRKMLQWLFTTGQHKKTVTSSQERIYKADGSTVLGTSTLSDDGTTFTKGKAQ